MITTDIGATKYTFGLKVGTVTLDPVVIWGQFQKNVAPILGIGYMTIGNTFTIAGVLDGIGVYKIGTFQIK